MLIRVFQPIRWFLADIKVGVVMSETCSNTRDWKGVSAPGKSGKISKWVKYNSGQNVLDTCLSCKENAIQVNPSPPRTVLSVTSQTPFTYLAQAIDLNFVQAGGGETLLGPVYECVLPVAANSIQKCVKRGKYWFQNLLTRIVVPIKKLIPMRQTYSIGGTVTRILRDTELRFVTPVLIW